MRAKELSTRHTTLVTKIKGLANPWMVGLIQKTGFTELSVALWVKPFSLINKSPLLLIKYFLVPAENGLCFTLNSERNAIAQGLSTSGMRTLRYLGCRGYGQVGGDRAGLGAWRQHLPWHIPTCCFLPRGGGGRGAHQELLVPCSTPGHLPTSHPSSLS